jgi:hypothetical protein
LIRRVQQEHPPTAYGCQLAIMKTDQGALTLGLE